MDKQTFLSELEKNLKLQNITDIEGILEEYEDHFNFKMADGYAEAEIAARLGNPVELAGQYRPALEPERPKRGGKVLLAIGLALLLLIVGALLIAFLAFVIALFAFAVACAVLGICLIGGFDFTGLIPFIPFPGSLIFGVVLLALAVLTSVGTCYSWRYLTQLIKAYAHWNRRLLSSDPSRRLSPALPKTPQFKPRSRRFLRRAAGISLIICGVGFVIGYIVLALQAGALEFWHVWSWFS